MSLLLDKAPKHYNRGPIKSLQIKAGKLGATEANGSSMTVTGLASLANSNGETWVFSYYLIGAGAVTNTFTTDSSVLKESGTANTIGTANISSDADAALAVRTAFYVWWATTNNGLNVVLYTVSDLVGNTFTVSDPGPPSPKSLIGDGGNVVSDPDYPGLVAAQSGTLISSGKITTTDFLGGFPGGSLKKYVVIVNETDLVGRFVFETAKKVHKSIYERQRRLVERDLSGTGKYTPPDNDLVGGNGPQADVLIRSRYDFLSPIETDTEGLALPATAGTKLIPVEVMDSTTATSLKAWYKAELFEGNTALASSLGTSVDIQDHSSIGNNLTKVNNPGVIAYNNSTNLSFVFNGADQYFTNASPTGFNIGTNGYAMFVVFTTPSSFTDDAYKTLFDRSAFSFSWYLRYKVDNQATPNGLIDLKMGSVVAANVQKAVALSPNTTYLLTAHKDGSNDLCALYVNGDGKVSATNNSNLSLANGPLDLGVAKSTARNGTITRQYYLDGYLQEFLFYDLGSGNDIADNPRERVEGYLAHKWGLAGDLPSDHPFKNGTPASISHTTSVDYTGTAIT